MHSIRNLRRAATVVASAALLAAGACVRVEHEEETIDLAAVPAVVRAAAEAAVPGIAISEAESETEDGVVVYEFEGVADGVEYELEVSADGKVLEVEKADEDKDDDDEDEDEDGEDDHD